MIKLINVYKYFNKGKKNEVRAIDNTSLTLPKTGIVSLTGPSGCGKSTLLNSIGGLSKVDKGSIYIDDEKITNRFTSKIDEIRSLKIGYIFQDFNLIDEETVFNNVALVLKINGLKDKEEIKKRVNFCLESLGIYRYRNRYAGMLSGGERQRVAIARAIVKDPEVIIADEPTGNLDSKNTIEVMNIIKSLSRDRLVILVTHEKELAYFYSDRIIEISDGKVVKDYINTDKDELDYKIDNKIYLKDIKKHYSVSKGNVNIDVYSDGLENSNIKLIIRNNNIYIENLENKKVEVVNESNVELVDAHYEKINKKVYEEFSFDYSKIKNNNYKEKYSSIYNLFNGVKLGFKKILDYSFIKKVLLLGFFFSSMFITYSVSNIMSNMHINEEDVISYNKDYLMITKDNMSSSEFNSLLNVDNVEYVLPGNSRVSMEVVYDKYLQTLGNNELITGSIASYSKVNNIVCGSNIVNSNQVVVDKILIDTFLNESQAKYAGYTKYEDFIGTYLILDNNQEYILVGIANTGSPSIYVMDSELINILYNNKNKPYDYNYDESIIYKDYNRSDIKTDIVLKDYEVLVNEELKSEYPINKTMNTLVNGNNLIVVGYYKGSNINYVYMNENTIKYSLLNNTNKIVISSSNKDNTLNKLKDKYSIVDTYKDSIDTYKRNLESSIKMELLFSITIVVISLIEIYLIIRSSFLSRVKEIGVLRSIGIKRIDVYKMFIGEILSITIIGSLPGISFMYYILKTISKIDYFNIVINPTIYIISLSICLVFNLLFGLIPVFNTIKKTPHEILSRNDVD